MENVKMYLPIAPIGSNIRKKDSVVDDVITRATLEARGMHR